MQVTCFLPWEPYIRSNPRGYAAAQSMAAGAKKHGHDVFFTSQEEGYRECDVAIMWGKTKNTMPPTAVRDQIIKKHGDRPFVHLERGYLDRESYESVGLNGMWGHGDYRNAWSPNDRFRALDIDLLPWDLTGDHIMIVGQVPWDTSVQHVDFSDWTRHTRAQLQGCEIRFRPHPAIKDPGVPLQEDLLRSSAVVTLTSTTAVDALIAGKRTIATDSGSMCFNLWGHKDALAVRRLPLVERTQFFYDLAYCQWTHKEMARGEAWAHLFRE